MKHLRQILSTLLTLAFLLSGPVCAWAEQDAASPEADGPEAESAMVMNDGDPWVDYSVRENVDLVEKRPDSPKDDFYLWANYDWLKSAEIAPGDYSAGPFVDAEHEIAALCLEVLNDPTLKGEDALLVQHLYREYLDWDARNALGTAPLKATIDRIAAVSTLDELTQLMNSSDYLGKRFIRFDVALGINDPDTWILYIDPMDLLLQDSAEYLEGTMKREKYEAAYQAYLPKMMEKLGYTPEETLDMLTRALALETELADTIIPMAEMYGIDYYQRVNNEMTRPEAEKLCSAFPWLECLDHCGYAGVQRYLVQSPAYMKKLDTIYREERLQDLKADLILKNVIPMMDMLDRESYDLYYAFYNFLAGTEGVRTDEENACELVRELLPFQFNRAFLEKYDVSKMQSDIRRLCAEIIDNYRGMLAGESWLSEDIRAKAIEKLDAMRIIVGFPEKQPGNDGLSLEGLGLYDSSLAIKRHGFAIGAGLADQPVDPDFLYITDEDFSSVNDMLYVNAVYDPQSNLFIINRGILGSPFYREDMSEEELYGSIGTIIAHEISHAFDPACAQFDAHGRLNNWWSDADYEVFSARAQKLIDYYDGITVFNGMRVPGENVQGEAVADITGVKCMLALLEQKKETVDYRAFFEAVAAGFREFIGADTEVLLFLSDIHPLCFVRVNTIVQQFQQFHDAYGIQEGDKMYLAPEDRVQVW